MGVQKDAGKLLRYIYDRYIIESSLSISPNDVINYTEWVAARIDKAIEYLNDSGFLKIAFIMGTTEGVKTFTIHGVTPSGIDIIENKDKFKTTFGFE